ncbi:MAG: MFS transporter [bacterium]
MAESDAVCTNRENLTTSSLSWPIVIWATAVHFIVDMYTNTIPSLLPSLALLQGLTMTQTGVVLTVHSITGSFLQPFVGLCLDRWGKSWWLAGSVVYSAAMIALIGLFPNYWSLLVLYALAGLGSALMHPLGSVLSVRSAGSQPGLAISVYSTGGNLGFSLGPLLAVWLVHRFGLPGLAYAFPFSILFALTYLGMRKELPVQVSTPRRVSQELGDIRITAAWWALIVLNIISWLRAWSQYIFTAYYPYHFINHGYDVSISAPILSTFLLAGTVGTLAGGLLADWIGRRAVILGSMVLAVVSTWLCLTPPGPLVWLGIFLAGAALHAMVPVSIVIAQELVPHQAGMAAGLMLGFAYGLGGLCTPITGRIADTYGIEMALKSTYPILVLAVLLCFLLPLRTPGASSAASYAGVTRDIDNK